MRSQSKKLIASLRSEPRGTLFDAADVKRAFVDAGACVKILPSGEYLTVSYGEHKGNIRFADKSRNTLHKPEGLIMYNIIGAICPVLE